MAVLFMASACMAGEPERYGGEVDGYAGMQHFPGVTKALLGGAIGKPIGQRSQLFVESGYIPFGGGNKMVNLAGGLNVGLPSGSDTVAPYLTFLGGLGREMGNGAGANRVTYGAGFGVRYFLAKQWGIRPEFRWQRYQVAEGGVNSYAFSVGLFYRFGGN